MLPWHKKVRAEWDLSPYKVLAVGRKGRKTTFDVNELVRHAMKDTRGLTYPFIGPTRQQAKEIVWDDHVGALLRMFNEIDLPHEVNQSDLSIRFPGTGKFVIDGSDNMESLRGKSDWGGVVCDEFASWKNKKEAWETVIEPNLIVHNAWCVFSGTPKGYEYFHTQSKKGDHEGIIEGEAFDKEGKRVLPNSQYRTYRFTSYDNPFLSRQWLDRKKDDTSEAVFNQEYLARFEKYTGLIYKEFDRRVHIVEPFLPLDYWQHYRAMDFGGVNPTACLWIAVSSTDDIYVYDEYYNSGQTINFHAGLIKAKTKRNIIGTFGDPSGNQQIMDYGAEEVYISPAVRVFKDGEDWVMSGINKVKDRLKVHPQTGKPRLYIASNCHNLIREIESYHWVENKYGDNVKDQPEKKDDHALDALRYFMCSYSPSDDNSYSADIYQDANIPTNKFTGY